MNYKFLNYDNNLPINIQFFDKQDNEPEWHKDIEIILVARGSANLDIKNTTYNLDGENLVLINSSEVHKLYNISEDSLIISLYFDPHYFEKYYTNFDKLYFSCNTSLIIDIDSDSKEKYHNMFSLCSSIMLSTLYNNNLDKIKILKNTFSLVEHLIDNFSLECSLDKPDLSVYHQRFNRILQYINENYTNKITLSDLAQREYLSTHYVSRFFNKYMGVGFIKYLNNFRLEKSMYDLVNTNKSILDLSLDHGFSSLKSYRNTFFEKYNMSPSVYRKNYTSANNMTESNSTLPSKNIAEFIDYLQKYESNQFSNPRVEYITKEINGVSFSKKNWVNFEKIFYFDNVYDALNSNWQKYFTKSIELIKPDFIKFAGIFNESMYDYDSIRNTYNWYNLESVLDFFSNIHITPFLKLEYDVKKESIKKFFARLESFILFCINKYDLESVREWKFELSSVEKDYPNMIKFYRTILDLIAETPTLSKLNFGIDFTINSNFHKEYFIKYIQDKKINFISIYASEKDFLDTKDFVRILLMKTKKLMKIKTYFIQQAENHYLNDTSYKATKIVHNVLNDYCECDSQFNFIDSSSNLSLFKGDTGMLTYNGINKPSFNALFVLSKLNGYLVDCGSGYIITKKQNSYSILLYNHQNIPDYFNHKSENYDKLYKNAKLKTKFIDLKINLEPGKYSLKSYIFNKKNGSIYDEWIKMGKPSVSNREVLRFLKSKESIGLKFSDTSVENSLHLKEHIILGSLKLIEINKV